MELNSNEKIEIVRIVKKILLCAFCALAFSAKTQTNLFFERLEVSGKTYTNCTVKKLNAVQALVLFDSGGMVVPSTNFPSDLQSKLRFSTNEVQRLEIIQQIKKKGVQLEDVLGQIKSEKSEEQSRRIFDGGYDSVNYHLVEGKVIQVLEGGKILVSVEKEDGAEIKSIIVAVKNYPLQTFDDAVVRIHVQQSGVYKYISVNNATKTVPLFDYGILGYKSAELPKLFQKSDELKKQIADLNKAGRDLHQNKTK